MKKSEVLALGVPEKKIKEFQCLYNRDLKNRIKTTSEGGYKEAIMALIPIIQEPESLQKILKTATHFYIMECSKKKAPEDEELE